MSNASEDAAVVAFVEHLLDDWEGDEYQIAGEWCVGKAEHDAVHDGIAARRAEWAALREHIEYLAVCEEDQ